MFLGLLAPLASKCDKSVMIVDVSFNKDLVSSAGQWTGVRFGNGAQVSTVWEIHKICEKKECLNVDFYKISIWPSKRSFVYLPVSKYLCTVSDMRENIIDKAEELIRTKGYNAFSYSDIAGVLHIRNAAIHYYFPSKADLGVGVVEREIGAIASSREEWEGLPGNVQLRKVMERFYNSYRRGWICLNGSLTPDFLTLPDPLQEKVKQMCEGILDWMTEALEKGRADGTLAFEGEAESRALLVISSLLSSLLLARVLGKEVLPRMLDQLLKDIECAPASRSGLDRSN